MHFYNNNIISDRLFGGSLFAKLSFTLLGVFLLTASAKVSIPFFPVPMTLQTFVIYFLAASSGMLGFSSALLYVTLGLVGLPIFASGGGIGYIASPTFGFLYGMVIASLFIAYMAKNYFKDNFFKILLSIVIGAVIIFGCGITHLSMFIGISKAFTLGVTPFIYSEILKIALAVFVTYALLKKTKQIN
jgi:biotin transporter BioY